MKARYFNFSSFLLLVTLLVFSACKKQFDEPPIADLPNLARNTTIAQLLSLAQTGTTVALDTQILEGTVIADDKSGNFYKQIVIQDSTGGVSIAIDAYSIYTDFPIGRQVWVKCSGLYLTKNSDGVGQLVGSTDPLASRLPQSIYKQYLIGGQYDQPIVPRLKNVNLLGPSDYNTLIKLDTVEFKECATYADAITPANVSLELVSCENQSMSLEVRSSGYSNFANQQVPVGNGSMVAVYAMYSGTHQFTIRNPSDIEMTDTNRCTTIIPCPYTGPTTQMSIQAVRDLYTGVPTPAPVGRKIVGIVISDIPGGNWQPQNMVIQEPGGAGITVRFNNAHNFNKGDEVEIDISGENIEEFKGLLQIYVDLSDAAALSFGNSITPRVATVADIITNANNWESTLVNVQNSTLSGNSDYSGYNVLLGDATGSVQLFSNYSNFSTVPLPTGTGNVTAVISDYNGLQMLIRDTSDVNIFGGGGGSTNLNQITIQDARNLFTGAATTGPDTTKIVGVVISDGVGGNWWSEQMIIQEVGGAGISVRFAGSHSFSVGDEVEVDISNQTIDEDNGLLQVGSVANGVPNSKATLLSTGNTITPQVVTVNDIIANANAWESTLVQVMNSDLSGNSDYSGFNVMLNDATGSVQLFSNFASFASTPLPAGTGDVTAVVSDYNALQMKIRNTSDVNIGGGGGPTTAMSIASVRALFPGSVPATTHIEGIVISDRVEGNITAKNIVVQNSNGSGIVVRFTADNTTINVGDSVKIDVSGIALTEFNGLMQVENVPNANATVLTTGNSITPRVATVADINTNAEAWESTLVQIMGATITGTTYGATPSISDGSTGNIDLYTRGAATFSGNTVPATAVNVTAIVSQFTSYQLNLRTLADVTP